MVLEVIGYFSLLVVATMIGALAYALRRAFARYRPPHYTSKLSDESDMPSVSVCIPARNEQHALTDCLQRVVTSTYERLEIIVLDDVSGDDTSSLIRSFAQDGVRFVQGKALPPGWLGKNHALQGLLDEASGSYILFMDVDTRLEPRAIEQLVRYAQVHRAAMVSVLPRREDGRRFSVFASPLRYFWEIIFDRTSAPATASNAWLIRRSTLAELHGFEAYKQSVRPEAHLAAQLSAQSAYRFLISTPELGVGYEKKWRSQLMTSTRLLFPFFHSQAALASIALLDLLVFLIPYVIIAISVATESFDILFFLSVGVVIASSFVYGFYTRRVWRQGWVLGALLWPLVILQEAILIVVSIIQYKRHAVRWKGRLVRAPYGDS